MVAFIGLGGLDEKKKQKTDGCVLCLKGPSDAAQISEGGNMQHVLSTETRRRAGMEGTLKRCNRYEDKTQRANSPRISEELEVKKRKGERKSLQSALEISAS